MSDHTYKVKYELDVKTGEFEADDVEGIEEGGLTDELVLVSILKNEHEDGTGISISFIGFNGEDPKEDIPSDDMFLVWLALAESLQNDDSLPRPLRAITAAAIAATKMAINPNMLKDMLEEARLEVMSKLGEKGEEN